MRFTGSTASSLRALPLSIIGFAAALLMVAAQLVHSPAPTHAVPQPAESTTPAYVSPEDLGDGAKPPEPTGTSWLVGDLDSGELHVAKNVEKRHAPASTIKLLTALALVDEFDDRKKKVTAEFEDMEVDGTKVGLMQTNKYSIDLLFHAMLMSSANDAANALGRAAGGQDKAVKLMNEKAAELGMSNTQAKNTSGLDAKGQYTTAEDLMKLAWAVCEDDYLMKVIGTETFKFPGGKNPQTKEKFKGYEIQNHTKIVGQVDGGLGLKNGFTRAAKGSYVAVAERDGHRVVATMLGIDNNSRQVAVDLLDWDFAQKDPKSLQTVPVGVQATAEAAPTATGSSSDAGGAESDSSGTTESQKSDESEPSIASQTVGAALDNPLALVLLAGGVVLFIATVILWLRIRARMQGRR
ncbi:D-alanyl-D-alanine carboxypeptidase (penicillin-binding protein 5/6) [Brevibacterium iodinum ATCC 49514]|uniref:D-alanyl-D-alanine carboxypeptidase (Penicillin-binding protein 5/6) n=1 Tax=Brevibacterium iodinum ATCC 49514 TaxID=1255616 RepID=A0A2H1JYQ5_9MICO|nr:serine hydrolase [Brevibacterium iodinum]SMX92611.1 D-alanyl-D-alanine carboxypeptidase (penicillin-binding protein 5/6) [Brevibacterium iodinum ATCC 49514]SUW13227.1 D-alanyl-D-alanine carboxypeptidase dacD precursor [Brevibacterium iodinum]